MPSGYCSQTINQRLTSQKLEGKIQEKTYWGSIPQGHLKVGQLKVSYSLFEDNERRAFDYENQKLKD